LWRRLQLGMVSVRRFRAEKTGSAEERTVVRDVYLCARRLGRALRRLAKDPDGQGPLPAEVARVLRRTERLIQRRLHTMEG
jgi:hypothetical protein